jgi:ABC-type arginine transport system permease subunit
VIPYILQLLAAAAAAAPVMHWAAAGASVISKQDVLFLVLMPQVPVLKAAGVDAACVGNHDFDFGIKNFR